MSVFIEQGNWIRNGIKWKYLITEMHISYGIGTGQETLNSSKGKWCNVECTKVICNLQVVMGLPILIRDFYASKNKDIRIDTSSFAVCCQKVLDMPTNVD